jgi:transposase-like protein
MPKYSSERKEAILKKMLPPYNMTVAALARQESIAEQTLYNWRFKAREKGQPVPGKKATSEDWSAETKLAIVIETTALSESELSEYCRKKGLYPDQIKRWKQASLRGFQRSDEQNRAIRQQAKTDKAEISKLKKELRLKEKALAETAALLVLRKKFDALWEEDDEGN